MRLQNIKNGYEVEVTHVNGDEWAACMNWARDNGINHALDIGGANGEPRHDYVIFEKKSDAIEFKMKWA